MAGAATLVGDVATDMDPAGDVATEDGAAAVAAAIHTGAIITTTTTAGYSH